MPKTKQVYFCPVKPAIGWISVNEAQIKAIRTVSNEPEHQASEGVDEMTEGRKRGNEGLTHTVDPFIQIIG